jgi:hypothetical protein
LFHDCSPWLVGLSLPLTIHLNGCIRRIYLPRLWRGRYGRELFLWYGYCPSLFDDGGRGIGGKTFGDFISQCFPIST